jgi:hypothetical protein
MNRLQSAALAVGIFTQCECPSGAASFSEGGILEMRLMGHWACETSTWALTLIGFAALGELGLA